jgi:hypothetical protein
MEQNLAPKWMSAIGDGPWAGGKKGYADYMQALEEDAKIRTHWEISWEKHQETLKGLGSVREKLKSVSGKGSRENS